MSALMEATRERYTAKWVDDNTYTPEEAAALAEQILADPFYMQNLKPWIIADLSDPLRRVNGLKSVSRYEKFLEHQRQVGQTKTPSEAAPISAPAPSSAAPAMTSASLVSQEQVEMLLEHRELPNPIRKKLKDGKPPAVRAEGVEMARQWLLERAEARRQARLAELKAVLHADAYEVLGQLHDLLAGFTPEQQAQVRQLMDARERYLADMAGLEYWTKRAQRLMKLWPQVGPLQAELHQLAFDANLQSSYSTFLSQADEDWNDPDKLEKWLASCQIKIQRRQAKAERRPKPQPTPEEQSKAALAAKENLPIGKPNAHGGTPRTVAAKKAKGGEAGKGKQKAKAGRK